MKNALVSLLLISSLSGCGSLGFFSREEVKPIETVSKPLEKTPLDIEQPQPIKTKPIQWVIVTKDNASSQLDKLEASGLDPVVFGLTDEGYKQLSLTIAELRNIISTQRNIIIRYKEYYEPPASKQDTPQTK